MKMYRQEQGFTIVKDFNLTSIIRLYGILHHKDSLSLYKAIDQSINAKVKTIIIDVRELKLISSGASQILDNCQERAKKNLVELLICK
ncbi:MAG: hypothetical protein QNJ38_03690 [Prochloraceae cyanobacterium]|nr:hypothetical protein [Prochloraceae cyanobacterium]